MGLFPDISASDTLSVELLRQMLPDIYVKANTTDRNSTSTLAADPDLQAIPLAVGTYWIRLMLFWTTPTDTVPDIKTQWGFSGTWNNPLRAILAPAAANTAASSAVTSLKMTAQSTNSDSAYGTAASAAYALAIEEAFNATVTVAGDLSLQWAQNTSDADITSVKSGSAFMIRRLA